MFTKRRGNKNVDNYFIVSLWYFPLILLSENFPSHASKVRWKIIANR